ncbi:MAG: NACHT domain-containing protein [Moorea sp. SIO4A3]|nr:NACHT domain-containing protein [Moorena sp. SIO4A3]
MFDKTIGNKLLILGKPGTGKTTMLLKLAKELVQRAENDFSKPVPILLSLSSWQNDQQSIGDWIVEKLTSSTGRYQVSKDIAEQWIKEGEIIPLLDELDELAPGRQEHCVEKLNEFLRTGIWCYPLVVCSRIEEYEFFSTKLALNKAIELHPFTNEQIQGYLKRTGNEQLWDRIKDEQELKQLAQIPLFLNMIVSSFQKLSLAEWHKFKSLEERQDYLISTYVKDMLAPGYRGKGPSNEKTKRWLNWLAGKLIQQNKTEFFIENIQPNLLSNNNQVWITRIIYSFIIAINYGLTAGCIIGLIFDSLKGKIIGVLFGTIYGFLIDQKQSCFKVSKSTTTITPKIQTVETLRFSFKKVGEKLPDGLIEGFKSGLIISLITLLVLQKEIGSWQKSLLGGLVLGIIGGLIGVLVGGLGGPEIEIKKTPNQGIRQSVINVFLLKIASYPISLAICMYINWWTIKDINFYQTLIIALLISFLFGLNEAGKPAIQHFSLRLILYCNGYIPWNYAHFLNYATNRLFLQRVGGSYRFMHNFLRQYFAKISSHIN